MSELTYNLKPSLKKRLEGLYAEYNRPEFIHPDPLEFLSKYSDPADREIVGLVASSLACGRVRQILKACSFVLEGMGSSPARFLQESTEDEIRASFGGFKHRFSGADHLRNFLVGIKFAVEKHGSLEKCFLDGWDNASETTLSALPAFADELETAGECGHLLPDPRKNSPCKRLNLFLRWVVRKDDVDPGGWTGIDASKLVIPLDTHMHKVGLALGFTSRKHTSIKTALDITQGFREVSPDDPVKYDFALTRLGIRDDADLGSFLNV